MDHGIEAVCSIRGKRAWSTPSVCRACRYLPRWPAPHQGKSERRSGRESIASWAPGCRPSGCRAKVPMGASHAIGHVLGGTCDVPHYFLHGGDDAERAALQQPPGHRTGAESRYRPRLGAPEREGQRGLCVLHCKTSACRGRLADVGVGEDRFELIGNNAMLSIFTRSKPAADPRAWRRDQDIEARRLISRSIGT